MTIRKAKASDIDRIFEIYGIAKEFMKATGNPHQWAGRYTSAAEIEPDIENGVCYVIEEDGTVHAVFALIPGPEFDYENGELDGGWLNDEPYATIHKVASDGILKGVVTKVTEFCRQKYSNLRIDTHQDNKVMQHCILRQGFVPCGLLHRPDGEYRLVYQQRF